MIDEIVVLGEVHMREGVSEAEYGQLRARMLDIVGAMKGFQSVKRFVSDDGEAINIYRFSSEDALGEWRRHPEHVKAMKRGHDEFYSGMSMQICRVIREVNFAHI